MSDRRRRYRKPKDERRPIILERNTKNVPNEIQPRILIKSRSDREIKDVKDLADIPSTSAEAAAAQNNPQRTIIVTRSDVQSPSLMKLTSPNTTEETAMVVNTSNKGTTHFNEPVPQMTRPVTVISSMGFINLNAKKLLLKTNTDFFVVGVLGTQGVGKSTVLNILANEDLDFDYYTKIFVDQDCVFPTKLKQSKFFSRSRTESTHMFITSDRMILIDTPPVLCNSYNKDMTANEIDDLRNIITTLSVCHLLIVIQDDYLNINLIRLLRLAELLKPSQDQHSLMTDHYPNVLFIKNRAKRLDFEEQDKGRLDKMYKALFKDSKLRIFMGQGNELQKLKRNRTQEIDRKLNIFLIPEVKGPSATPYCNKISEIVGKLRASVFTTPRCEMYVRPTELTETIWFELLSKISQDIKYFFIRTYEDIHRKHLEVNSSGNMDANRTGSTTLATKDTWRDDIWRDK